MGSFVPMTQGLERLERVGPPGPKAGFFGRLNLRKLAEVPSGLGTHELDISSWVRLDFFQDQALWLVSFIA